MEKIYGSPVRQDGIYKIGRNKYELIYGFGEDENGGWNWRERFDHEPTMDEIKNAIIATINADTDERILTGFTWNGKPVWLSQENQMNFKAAYDITVQTNGSTLPIKFKLGEDATGQPVYHTFTKIESFSDFYLKAFAYINATLNQGWKEKDSVDFSAYQSVITNE